MIQAMEDSLAAAEPLMRQRASTAVAALSQHGWTPAVTGTGAALAAETATSICANQLIQEVTLDLSTFTLQPFLHYFPSTTPQICIAARISEL